MLFTEGVQRGLPGQKEQTMNFTEASAIRHQMDLTQAEGILAMINESAEIIHSTRPVDPDVYREHVREADQLWSTLTIHGWTVEDGRLARIAANEI